MPLPISVFLLFQGFAALGQQNTTSAGADVTHASGSVAYSVGQVDYTYFFSNSGSVSQGVQQPYEIYSVGIKETSLDIALRVFPNPTPDYLNLTISGYNGQKLSFKLMDMNGKLMEAYPILASETKIDMQTLTPAIYIINIFQENRQIQSFKIIKK